MAKQSKYKSYTWLILFLPSVTYYIYRLTQTHFSAVFSHVESNIIMHNKAKTATLFSSPLTSSVVEVVSQNYTLLNGLTWFHDIELGRGYLLLSDIISNRLWKWEVGGGLITIGKSLHMERAGCRSKHCSITTATKGSAALGILPELDDSTKDILIISEYGEERLIKLEVDGARNPLIYDVQIKDFVILPPLGDIIYVDEKTNGIWKLKEGVNVPAIPASESRSAHEKDWKGRHLLNKPELIFSVPEYGDVHDEVIGIVMLDWDHVIVTAKLKGQLVLLKIFVGEELTEEEEDDYWGQEEEMKNEALEEVLIQPDGTSIIVSPSEDEDQDNTNSNTTKEKSKSNTAHDTSLPKHVTLLKDISSLLPSSSSYTKIGIPTLDQNNYIYIPIPQYGILILDTYSSSFESISTLKLPSSSEVESYCTHVTFGDDYYLYILCQTKLIRIKTLVQGKKMEKDLYKKKKVKKVL